MMKKIEMLSDMTAAHDEMWEALIKRHYLSVSQNSNVKLIKAPTLVRLWLRLRCCCWARWRRLLLKLESVVALRMQRPLPLRWRLWAIILPATHFTIYTAASDFRPTVLLKTRSRRATHKTCSKYLSNEERLRAKGKT